MLLKEDVYNTKIKNNEDKTPDITNLIYNTTLDAKINQVKSEITSINNLTAALNPKINEVKCKIPIITNLNTTTVLTAVENEMVNVSNLVKQD